MPPRGKIPDRWIPYKACGDVIEGTRFICFKVPLYKNIQKRVADIKKIWDVPAVLSEIPKLGAVIDLTNTGRYYNPSDFQAANVLHKKILMPGREIPPEEKVREFMDTVDEFLGKDREALVGVHCTHGLNRTGYMVCRYMRDRLNIPAKDAIKRFEKARGYKIERDIYLAGLLGKNLPPPDFGKKTVIKPLNTQFTISDEDSPRQDYFNRFVNNKTIQTHNRYESNNRYNPDRNIYFNNRNNMNTANGYHQSWRNRDNRDDGNRHFNNSDNMNPANGYQQSWRYRDNRDDGNRQFNNRDNMNPANGYQQSWKYRGRGTNNVPQNPRYGNFRGRFGPVSNRSGYNGYNNTRDY